jgi:transposase InsO family protein
LSARRYTLSRGDSVYVDGGVHLVLSFIGAQVMLRSADGHEWSCEVVELFARSDFRFITAKPPRAPASPAASELEVLLDEDVLAEAEELLAHLNEMRTGYRSGDENDALPQEPRAEYDPGRPEAERAQAKAEELKALGHRAAAPSTLRNLWKAWREQGLVALVDKRHLRPLGFREPLDQRVEQAADELFERFKKRSDISLKNFWRQLEVELEQRHGAGEVPLPSSESSLRRRIKALGEPRGFFIKGAHAKRRMQRSSAPTGTYFRKLPDRHGEFVLIDASPQNVFAVDSILLEVVRLDLLVAMDLYTRSIVGWRLTPTNTSRVDAALLLRDIIMPKPWDPTWPQEAKWRYHGIPETVVLDLCSAYGLPHGASGVPIVKPQTVVADNAWAYGSRAFRDACQRLDITIQPARPARPTDKAHIERFFHTVDEQFFSQLAGYTGPNILARGAHPERDAFTSRTSSKPSSPTGLPATTSAPSTTAATSAPTVIWRSARTTCSTRASRARGSCTFPPTPTCTSSCCPPSRSRSSTTASTRSDCRRTDSEVLDDYRGRPSGIGGELGDRYVFRYDPRDRSHLYFRHELGDGRFHAIPWSGRRRGDGPMGDMVLAHAKRIVRQRGGHSSDHDRKEQLEAVLRDLIRRNRIAPELLDERRSLKRALAAEEGLTRDRRALAPERLPYTEAAAPHADPLAGRVIDETDAGDDADLDDEFEDWGGRIE